MKKDERRSQMLIDHVFDDLCCRFVANLPLEELHNSDRLLVHVEQSHWYYTDFLCPKNPSLPELEFKEFSEKILSRVPIFKDILTSLSESINHFDNYKSRIPVFGAIILNSSLDKILMVQNYLHRWMWGFPKGKIDQGESEVECACREVYEETNLEIKSYVNEEQFISFSDRKKKKTKLFIVTDVPDSIVTMPRTQKEVLEVRWFPIETLCQQRENKELIVSHFEAVYP
eukprot:TRINITY_DN6085_c0_g2_i3.p1 TRINITY_DN6085_c0_g2~~TRINITY_DN6085_c0_g2_i3.p1  ORF type:complete len:229 (+),score=48.85 TRINITY_DN6085_c0_g2_i3:30-716(+)